MLKAVSIGWSRTQRKCLWRHHESLVDPGIELVVCLLIIFVFLNLWWELQFGKQTKCVRDRKTKVQEPVSCTFGRGAKALYDVEPPRFFDPRITYTVSWISYVYGSPILCRPLSGQAEREMSVPGLYETNHSPTSVHILCENLHVFRLFVMHIWHSHNALVRCAFLIRYSCISESLNSAFRVCFSLHYCTL